MIYDKYGGKNTGPQCVKFNGYNLKVLYHCHFVFVILQSRGKKVESVAAYHFMT
jgi:hypothetical protein